MDGRVPDEAFGPYGLRRESEVLADRLAGLLQVANRTVEAKPTQLCLDDRRRAPAAASSSHGGPTLH